MCGIFFGLESSSTSSENNAKAHLAQCRTFLENRGPDLHSQLEIHYYGSYKMLFCGSVLWLQGSCPTPQPAVDHHGNVLLWNGDVFNLDESQKTLSDTKILLDKLHNCSTSQEISEICTQIQGPWAFVYYKKDLDSIIFGRDQFGRHSLLWNLDNNGDFNNDEINLNVKNFILSSVAILDSSVSTEVPSTGIFQLSATKEFLQLRQIFTWEKYQINHFIPVLQDLRSKEDEIFSTFAETFSRDLDIFHQKLLNAVQVRVRCQPLLCKDCTQQKLKENQQVICKHTKTAVLFSGGLDSAVLAALVDECLPPEESIDLLNVAFEQKMKNGKKLDLSNFDVPDRATGLQALNELRKISPNRKWNFVEVNVTIEELSALRTQHISPLIFPLVTVLDDSIGCAQWFAARGKGIIRTEDGNFINYTSPARVILMGAGADEQLGGYARHRNRFQHGGWSGLCAELQMEMQRISHRNLGRDNRVISDHGRALRLPYLDENVVSFLAGLPIHCKADPRYQQGIGDKILLRILACKLGFVKTSLEAKRAIQFGSRIAKAEGRNERGSDVCTRLHKS